jgi:hypothetical protein
MLRIAFSILHIIILLFLPFIILIRGAVYFHQYHQLFPLLAIISGVLLCSLLLLIYVSFLFGRVGTDSTFSLSFSTKMKLVMAVVIIFCIHGIFFLRSDNLKNPSLKHNIHKLHPIIRLAVSTVIFLDKDLIVTDGLRVPEDYRRMGLPSNKTSLHYQQKDGYAYAVDIRTNNRSMVRNALMRVYFKLMGFRSLRHSGSDDHLHVSLYCPYLPRSF